jgi:hypothetical protein
MRRDVVDALVEDDLGETMDREDEVDALEILRSRVTREAALGEGNCERLGVGILADDGPATAVSIVRREGDITDMQGLGMCLS